ncbi:MAG: acetylornithine/succinylornithine family transaminase [Ruminococcaceae bacterium]|nr:acetylornithine/succinylornithine family transaminase [Oscillospiraceae bacterium]
MSTIIERDKAFVASTYGRFDVELVKGSGAVLYDSCGKEYIDLGAGIAVNTFGACDKEWIEAVTAQLNKIQHTSNLYYTEPCTLLAEKLCEKSGLKKVFFSNSGAEANECAIKVARKYYADNHGGAEGEIITLKNSFHGRTVATLKATGQDVFHKNFGPFPDGFKYCEANNCDELKALVDNRTAAVMIEIVQGEGGVNTLTKEFIDCIKELSEKAGFLIVVDEVQTGNGRTGKYFAFQHLCLEPDIVSTAKGLGGGLPLGATLLGERVKDTLAAGDHGSTFGGNPVACAGALSIVDRIDEKLLKEVAEKGEYIKAKLLKIPKVKSVSGLGLMLGIEIDGDAKQTANECLKKGVLILTAKSKLRMVPPLNITFEQIDAAIEILKECL